MIYVMQNILDCKNAKTRQFDEFYNVSISFACVVFPMKAFLISSSSSPISSSTSMTRSISSTLVSPATTFSKPSSSRLVTSDSLYTKCLSSFF